LCFEIRWPRPIWSVNVFFMHSASAVDIYRAQRKHVNYSIWPSLDLGLLYSAVNYRNGHLPRIIFSLAHPSPRPQIT
jgi:hypothetical protein